MNDNQQEPYDSALILRQFSKAFNNHKRLFYQTIMVVLVLGVTYAYVKRPSYESTARLYVKLDQRGVTFSPAETRFQVAQKMADEAVATEAEMLGGDDLIEEVIDVLGPDVFKGKKPGNFIVAFLLDVVTDLQEGLMNGIAAVGLVPKETPKAKAIKVVKKDLNVFPVRKTQVIELAFRHKNAEATQKILATLIDLHSKKLARLNDDTEDYEFYHRQALKLLDENDKAVMALLTFKQQHHVVDLQTEITMLIQRIDNMTAILDGTSLPVSLPTNAGGGDGDKGLADPINASQVGTPQANTDILQLAARLNDLKVEHARRSTLYEKNHPMCKELEVQIAGISAILKKNVNHLVTTINGYKNRLNLLITIEPELNRLARTVQASEDHYRTYAVAADERRLAKEQQSRITVQVVDVPKVPSQPVSTSRLIMVLVALLAALLMAAAIIILVDWLQTKGVVKQPVSS